jgi:hypothetical protein
MTVLTLDQIKEQYPDQWVLIGDPELREPEVGMPITDNLLRAAVLFASKDPRDLGYKASSVRGDSQTITYFYTGEMPQNRRWLL